MFLMDSSVYDRPLDLSQSWKNGFERPFMAQIGQKTVKTVDLHKNVRLSRIFQV